MEVGKFYFIKDEYYDKFDNCGLMGNKGEEHSRPCFFCLEMDGLYWMVPISSKVEKYEKIFNEKMLRYGGKFDGIRFGFVNGEKRAFLLQNLCPITEKYAGDKYQIQNNTVDVTINDNLKKELFASVKKILCLYKRGIKIALTDLDKIIAGL